MSTNRKPAAARRVVEILSLEDPVSDITKEAVEETSLDRPNKLEFRMRPSIDELLDDGLQIIWEEFCRLRQKAKSEGLSSSEIRMFTNLSDSLVKLSKEDRARMELLDFSSKSTDDLLKELSGS
jgi:hypothetical protein